jgi:hypothetical protein
MVRNHTFLMGRHRLHSKKQFLQLVVKLCISPKALNNVILVNLREKKISQTILIKAINTA